MEGISNNSLAFSIHTQDNFIHNMNFASMTILNMDKVTIERRYNKLLPRSSPTSCSWLSNKIDYLIDKILKFMNDIMTRNGCDIVTISHSPYTLGWTINYVHNGRALSICLIAIATRHPISSPPLYMYTLTSLMRHSIIRDPRYYDTFLGDWPFQFKTPSFIQLRHSIVRHLESMFCHIEEVVNPKMSLIYIMYI